MSCQEKRPNGKSGDSGHSGETAPPKPPVAVDISSELQSRNDKQAPKKRKGEAEKLLESCTIGRPKRRASAKDKVRSLAISHFSISS